MSKLFKSKFLLGVMIVAAMFVFAGTVGTKTAAADCSITTTLRVGSVGSQVSCLQSGLNAGLVADGKFGPKTAAAVKAWQTAKGLVADGVFGPKSLAVWLGSMGGMYPAGCSSSTGYSSTTGLPCSGGGSLPAGCASSSGYSTTTGQPCSGGSSLPPGCLPGSAYSSVTGQPCVATTTNNNGTNGYLSDFASDSTNRVSTVYESETDKVVAGLRATARLADQKVERVRVTFENTDTNSSANLNRYITGASLWYGSTRIATIAVSDADRNTSSDVYTFNFSGLNAKVMKDQIGRFYVSVNANGSIDTNDTTAAWTVSFVDGGVLYSSPDGSSDTVTNGATTITGVMFGKFSDNGVKATVGLANTNPAANTVAVQSTTSATNGVDLLKFTVKATNSDLTIRKIPIQIASSGSNVSDIVNTVKLYRDGVLMDSVDGSSSFTVTGSGINPSASNSTCTSCGFIFSNLSTPQNKIASGSTATFTVTVDLKGEDTGSNYSDGETLKASFTNVDAVSSTYLDFSVQDVNGDQLTKTSAFRVGSGIGNIMTLQENGVNVVMSSASVSTQQNTAGEITQVTWSIPLTITAFGNTLYTGQFAENNTAASGTGASTNALSFALIGSNGSSYTDGVCGNACSATFETSDALTENNGFRLDSGSTKHFTLKVTLTDPAVSDISYRVRINDIRTQNDSLLGSPSNQTLLPVESYQTGFQLINN